VSRLFTSWSPWSQSQHVEAVLAILVGGHHCSVPQINSKAVGVNCNIWRLMMCYSKLNFKELIH